MQIPSNQITVIGTAIIAILKVEGDSLFSQRILEQQQWLFIECNNRTGVSQHQRLKPSY